MLRILPIFLLLGMAIQGHAQVLINEISCSNQKQFKDDHDDYNDWFELYNAGSTTVNLGGWHLSDKQNNPTKFTIPAGFSIAPNGFLRIWASGRNVAAPAGIHTNFTLTQTKSTAEFVVVADAVGNIVDTKKLSKKTQSQHSYGRSTDGGTDWSIFVEPTPSSSNNVATPYSGYAQKPDASLNAGFYAGIQTVELTTDEPGGVIHYTLDGKPPTEQSPIYAAPLSIGATTVVKAATFSPDTTVLSSYIRYNTYFIDVNHSVPVISIAADELDILANGQDELPEIIGIDTSIWQGDTFTFPIHARRRPYGSFEYFDLMKQRTASTYGEYDRHGQDSWAHSHRSLDFTSRDEMGYDYAIKEKLFALSPRTEFQRIILRAAGDDNYPADHDPNNEGSAHVRDAYIQNLAIEGGMKLDSRTATKAVVYLNGEYWGLYDIRERPDDADYTKYHYDQDKYHLQYVNTWGNTWSSYGGQRAQDDWNNFRDTIMGIDVTQANNYQYVTDRLDVVSMMDYMILNSFTVCTDWLNYNVGWWRGLDPAGTHQKWGFNLWDNDAIFGFYINYTGVPDQGPQAPPCNIDGLTEDWPDVNGHMRLFNHLRTNPDFERTYITRQIDLWNTTFNCEHMIQNLDSIIAVIAPEMPMQCERWGGNMDEWMTNVETLRNYILDRCAYLGDGLKDCYLLTGPYTLTIDAAPAEGGSVQLNTLNINTFPWVGQYFGGVDNTLSTTTNQGYFFKKWTSNDTLLNTNASLSLSLNGAANITAHFSTSALSNNDLQGQQPTVKVFPTLFQNTATVDYNLPQSAAVRVQLFDAKGSLVATFEAPKQNAQSGQHVLQLDFGNTQIPSGVYSLEFVAGDYRKAVKMVKM